MRRYLLRLSLVAGITIASAGAAAAQVCVRIDDAHDTLAPEDRSAAVMLIANQLQLAGERVVEDGCTATYLISHVRLGSLITVTMSGPHGYREGKAVDLDDLPPLYSQMVRSMLTGKPVGSIGVVDRTNVTAAQNVPARRVQSDSFWYARLGYGGIFGNQAYGMPAMGFGYRGEFDTFGVDVSFLNYGFHNAGSYYAGSTSANTTSLLKLEGMYFVNPIANTTPYFGAGLSWGNTAFGSGMTMFHGNGIQSELTAGYEVGRAASVRLFVQADAVLPFYSAESQTFTYTRAVNGAYSMPIVTTDHRYAPSLVVSLGIGWQRGRR